MMKKLLIRIAIASLFTLTAHERGWAAALDAGALVCVYGESGAAVAGATVILDGVLSRRESVTRADGCTLFSPLAPGTWDVTAEAPGRSTRIRIGLRLDPAEVSRLELELPEGDEIIASTDDRVLPDLSARRPLTRTQDSLMRRPGDSDLDAVVSELPAASPSWISSYPLGVEDPRTYAGLPARVRRVRIDGARLDGLINGSSNLEWLDPVAIGGVVADDTEGAPVIELLARPPVRSNGGISLALTDEALQNSGAASLEDFSQLRARFGTPLLVDHAALDASFSRASGTMDLSGRREDHVTQGWHVRSVARWGDRQTSRLLLLGGREQRRDVLDAQRTLGTTTRVAGVGHQYFRPLWSLEASGELLRSNGERGSAREEEQGEGGRLELVRILATRGSDHEFHLVIEERENHSTHDDVRTTAAQIRDRWIGGRFTADLALRWSRRQVGSGTAASVDPRLDLAARVNESTGTVLLLSGGSRAVDAVDLTGPAVDETLRFGVIRVTQPLGEWTVGEAGLGWSDQIVDTVSEVSSRRGWLSVRRRYSSGYAVRGYARWGEFEGTSFDENQSEWSAGGELTVELPTGWGMAVAGELRDQGLQPDEGMLGNVDVRLSRAISVASTVRMGIWTEVRNALDADGVSFIREDEVPVLRQPRTLVLGASMEF